MILLLTILFVSALLVLLAGGLLATAGLIPPEAPRTFLAPGDYTRPAAGKCDLSEDDLWWRDWWTFTDYAD